MCTQKHRVQSKTATNMKVSVNFNLFLFLLQKQKILYKLFCKGNEREQNGQFFFCPNDIIKRSKFKVKRKYCTCLQTYKKKIMVKGTVPKNTFLL